MIVRVERMAPFPREAVYAWWTDFREDDHGSRGSPATSRREIVRREGNELWIRDRARRPAPVTVLEHVTLDPPNGYRVEAHYPAVDARYEYRFDAVADGTAIRLTADLTPHHLGRLLARLFQGSIRRYAERDTDFHLHEMAQDLTERQG
jgi:hypothetical protein